MKPPGLMSENPKLKTDFYPANWFLSLAVSFWGLRRVKYAWIQHECFDLLRKKRKQQTNDIKSLFDRDKQNLESIFCFRQLCRSPRTLLDLLFSSEEETQSHLLTEHVPNWCIIPNTYVFRYTHMLPSFHWLKRRQTFKSPRRPIFQIYSLNSPNSPLNECN